MEHNQLNRLIDLTATISDKAYALFGCGDITSDYQRISNDLFLLKRRLNKPELYVFVGGEAKVGKSTFINCIIGKDVCPIADVVCTNVPSLIRYGKEEKVLVHCKSNDDDIAPKRKEISFDRIAEYSTESKNSRNKESVDYIEIFVNSSVLATGLVLIDTPGLGALDPRHAVATFEMASQADAILFLGNTDKELSSFEIESLKQLINCSKCGYVAHILTCCDRGDESAIRSANESAMAKSITQHKIETICVSSLTYNRYLANNNEAYLQKSGYKNVFAFMEKISAIQKDILCRICAGELLFGVEELRSRIGIIKETAEDPIKLEARLRELESCKKRLYEISENSSSWKNSFERKQIDLQSGITQFISDWQSKIDNEIDSLVRDDIYLDSKEMLTSAIQSKLTVFKSELDKKIQSRMLEIYLDVKAETGLTALQEVIHTSGIDIAKLRLPDDCGNVSKFNVAKSHVGSFMLGGVVAKGIGFAATTLGIGIPAVSAKIGAVVGCIAPGIGNLIGAAGGFILGGLVALAISVFQSKDSKRRKLAGDCKRVVADFFNKVRVKVSSALTDNRLVLAAQFEQELKSQQKDCSSRIKKLQPMAATARANWNTVVDMYKTLSTLSDELSKAK